LVKIEPKDLAKLDLETRVVAEKIIAVDRRRELLVSQRGGLAKGVDSLKNLIAQVPRVQNGLNRLNRQRELLQKSLDELSGKLAEARLGEKLEQDQQAERFEVIEQPLTPTEPVKPNRRKIMALGFALALAGAAGAVMGLESLDKTIRSGHDLTRALGRPVLAVIPYLSTLREQRRQRRRLAYAGATAAVLCAVALLIIHIMVMPLDIAAMKVMTRLEI
jgi:hypothetical protein